MVCGGSAFTREPPLQRGAFGDQFAFVFDRSLQLPEWPRPMIKLIVIAKITAPSR